ncbi:MAG: hypothetical protein AB1Z98_22775 [Nannocystaceae bacterium]
MAHRSLMALALFALAGLGGCSEGAAIGRVSVSGLDTLAQTSVDVRAGQVVSLWHELSARCDPGEATAMRWVVEPSIDGESLGTLTCDPWKDSNSCRRKSRQDMVRRDSQFWNHCRLTRCDLKIDRSGTLEVRVRLEGHPSTEVEQAAVVLRRE